MGSGLARHRKRKHSWNPYTSEIRRLSIYPHIQTPRDENRLRRGMEIEVYINNIDERGNGIANYRGHRIIVYNASVGSKVKARIIKISGDTAYAEIIRTISESSVEY